MKRILSRSRISSRAGSHARGPAALRLRSGQAWEPPLLQNRGALILPFLLMAALLVVATSVIAQTSTNYDQSWHVMAGAGAPSSSANFAVNGSLTQFAVGMSESDSYRAESGYWFGIAPVIPHLPVGGLIVPVSKLGLLAPWAGVVLLVVVGGTLLIWHLSKAR
jgi:hypothetical protein